MTKRQQVIASYLPQCDVLADVGCDHGYLTKYALDSGLCDRAYISDISAKSLQKAQLLLREEIAAGRCTPVVCDGLSGYPFLPDCVLIAGMGGEEIIKILTPFSLPDNFVLQPMKNAGKVRKFLIERGVTITADFTFCDTKYYDLIVGKSGGHEKYSEREFKYGRDNLHHPSADFFEKMKGEREKLHAALQNASRGAREEMKKRLEETEEILHEIAKNL